MTRYNLTLYFEGANSKEVPRKFTYDVTEVNVGDEIATVVGDRDSLLAALNAVSDAGIIRSTITIEENHVATPGGDVFEQGLLIFDLNDPEDLNKTGDFTIPAPSIGIFQGATGKARDRIDINDGDLNTLMVVLQTFEWSDGEPIDPAQGVQGLLEGRRKLSSMKLGT